jgi:hypothetical protein
MSQNLPIPLRKGAEQHASEQTAQMRAWLRWAKETLGLKNANDDTADYGGEYRQGSQLDKLRLAATRKELEAIEFDKDDSDVIEALDNIVGPGRKKRPKHFENASEGRLLRYLSGRFKDAKKFFRDKLFRDEVTKAAETEAYERAEENARFYGMASSASTRSPTAAASSSKSPMIRKTACRRRSGCRSAARASISWR